MVFKPGQSGNPLGGAKAKPFRDAIRMVLTEGENAGTPRTYRRLVEAMVDKGLGGDVAALKELFDRMDGKVPQAIGGTDELPGIKGIAWLEPTKK